MVSLHSGGIQAYRHTQALFLPFTAVHNLEVVLMMPSVRTLSIVVASLSIVVGIAGPAPAAVRLQFKGTTESFDNGELRDSKTGIETIFVNADRVVAETEGSRTILNVSKGVIIFIDDTDGTYTTAKLPLLLEDYANDEQKAFMQKVSSYYAGLRVDISQSQDVEVLDGREVRKVRVNVAAADNSIRLTMDAWLANVQAVDAEAYDTYSRSRFALSMFLRSWAGQVIDLEGFAVYQKTTVITGHRGKVDIQRIVSVEEGVSIPLEKTVPPADYRQVPFDVSNYIGFPGTVRRLP